MKNRHKQITIKQHILALQLYNKTSNILDPSEGLCLENCFRVMLLQVY